MWDYATQYPRRLQWPWEKSEKNWHFEHLSPLALCAHVWSIWSGQVSKYWQGVNKTDQASILSHNMFISDATRIWTRDGKQLKKMFKLYQHDSLLFGVFLQIFLYKTVQNSEFHSFWIWEERLLDAKCRMPKWVETIWNDFEISFLLKSFPDIILLPLSKTSTIYIHFSNI